MRLLRRNDTGEFSLTQFRDEAIPPYAILSHTWGADYEEVTFDDLTNGSGQDKPGYKKIRFCGEQAAQDNLEYFWVDTCCIDKANMVELSQAINSMFRWYRTSTRCYVYLSDVSSCLFETNEESNPRPWESDFRKSRWFTLHWTLQELLAPISVEFFSREHRRLGDKSSLRQQIHEMTGIPMLALLGAPLSQFSVKERLSWTANRRTKWEEDEAYSLLGIFDVYMPPIYGEGKGRAFQRLIDKIDKRERCIQDLRLTDPRDDKKRIEDTKGGLLKDSYHWVLENSNFQKWRNDQQSRLLWIKGDPGKGKTMLLCGIINELNKSMAKTDQLSYFFCQSTDSRINSGTAVLRGLLYLLVNQQPSLVSHIWKKHDHAGKALFEDANAYVALSEIFTNILQDPSLNMTYLIIDALDECVVDLRKLLYFIQMSRLSSRVKWLISSCNNTNIEQILRLDDSAATLNLDQSRSDQAEKFGWQVGAERFLWGKEPAPASKLTKKRSLGDGRLGKVEEVIAQGGSATMARKRFFVPHFREKRAKAQIQRIEGEITSLKRLSHLHIVTIIGCYQEEEGMKHLAIYTLMQPVGDGDLKTFLEAESTTIEHEERLKWIKKWFVCLTSALAYMHSEHVYHEDIKPNNIIYRSDHVFFTDFSSSRCLEAGDETSTTSEAIATRLFAAPEAFHSDNGEILSHGSKTDVFSLGLVFVELFVVLIRERIETFRNHVFGDYKSGSKQYHRVSHKFKDFFLKDVESNSGDSTLRIYSQCFEHMLRKERKDRPSAKNVLAKMKTREFFGPVLGCKCAHGNEMEDSDNDSDWEYLEDAQS